ncbi:DUF1361 domain-containing protein [soil metagenome]
MALSSALAIVLLTMRIAWTHERAYVFLVWNLFLAWVPYGCAIAIRALHGRRLGSLALVPFFVLWLGFLPNAPYLVTDFVHLRFRVGAPLWFDAVMLAAFAWAGVGLGTASLRVCAHVVRVRAGSLAVLAFTPLVALATGFGIYLGRFLRLNTWDVATRPGTVLVQMLSPLMDPRGHVHAWTVTLTFAMFFAVATVVSGRARSPALERF